MHTCKTYSKRRSRPALRSFMQAMEVWQATLLNAPRHQLFPLSAASLPHGPKLHLPTKLHLWDTQWLKGIQPIIFGSTLRKFLIQTNLSKMLQELTEGTIDKWWQWSAARCWPSVLWVAPLGTLLHSWLMPSIVRYSKGVLLGHQ